MAGTRPQITFWQHRPVGPGHGQDCIVKLDRFEGFVDGSGASLAVAMQLPSTFPELPALMPFVYRRPRRDRQLAGNIDKSKSKVQTAKPAARHDPYQSERANIPRRLPA